MKFIEFNKNKVWDMEQDVFISRYLPHLIKHVSEKEATKYLKKKYRELTRVKPKNTKSKSSKAVRGNSRGKRE